MNIVMYHYVRPKNPKNGKLRYLTLDQFQNQLDYFEKNLGFLSQEEFIYNYKSRVMVKGFMFASFTNVKYITRQITGRRNFSFNK